MKERIRGDMDRLGLSKAELSRRCKVSKPTVGAWLDGSTLDINGKNLVTLASVLGVSEAWLQGKSSVRERIGNLHLVKDVPDDDDVQIPQFNVAVAAGNGIPTEDHEMPTDYVTFKKSWIKLVK